MSSMGEGARIVVETPKLAQRLAARIEREILDGDLQPGHRLGTEIELIRRYGVSRAALREAIRLVERHQLAETRRGTGGGLFVAQPAEEVVAQVLCAYLESIRTEVGELFEALRLVQTETARLAARRAKRVGAEALRRLLEAQSVPAPPEEESLRFQAFYATIADLASSPALALFVRALDQATQHIGLGLHIQRESALRDWKALRRGMLAIERAISAGDDITAGRAMTRYLGVLERGFSRRKPRIRSRVAIGRKRGAVIAREIGEDIRRMGLVPGDKLGSESELIARYEVSRAALREAVRLLEQHGVVAMRRGIGGGLICCEPDPGSVIRSASTYLHHVGLRVEHFETARLLIEPAAAGLAAKNASAEDLKGLSQALDALLELDGHEVGRASRRLHERIADLSGNRVLGLFARVLITAAWGIEPRPKLPRGAWKRIRDNDVGIVEAMVRRDAAEAEIRMQDHLKLTLGWWAEFHPRAR